MTSDAQERGVLILVSTLYADHGTSAGKHVSVIHAVGTGSRKPYRRLRLTPGILPQQFYRIIFHI